jgi:uncharacterized protein YjbJ (UPF0337 family)
MAPMAGHFANSRRSAVLQRGVPAVSQSRFSFLEQVMIVNKDQVKGRVREAEGKAKEVAGKMAGNGKLALKGSVQRALGAAQAKFGDIKQNMKDSKKGA